MSKEQRGIQSIDVGGRLLQALAAASGALMLKEIALAANMPAAKAHAYLVSFCKLGLMEQDAETGRYDLGPLALQLGLASLHRLDAVKVATRELTELAARTHQSVAIAVWGNFGPTIVRFEQSARPIHVNMRTGTVMALTETATGLALTAHVRDGAINAALETMYHDSKARTAAKKKLADQGALLADVRKRRLARAQGHPVPGVSAFSAPVFDHNGDVALAITALGSTADFDSAWTSPIATEVTAAAKRISERLGYAG